MKKYALIVAAGKGTRMQQSLPKQFIELLGKPILMHTLELFHAADIQIILVLSEDYIPYWKEQCSLHQFKVPHEICAGAAERYDSVKCGLQTIQEEQALVAIHDAVRPLLRKEDLEKAYQQAAEKGNAILCVPSKDSIRRVLSEKNEALPRNEIMLIQTPQVFQLSQLKNAYHAPFQAEFSDDASVVERAGYAIHLIEGHPSNIKITYPDDLRFAELLLSKQK